MYEAIRVQGSKESDGPNAEGFRVQGYNGPESTNTILGVAIILYEYGGIIYYSVLYYHTQYYIMLYYYYTRLCYNIICYIIIHQLALCDNILCAVIL